MLQLWPLFHRGKCYLYQVTTYRHIWDVIVVNCYRHIQTMPLRPETATQLLLSMPTFLWHLLCSVEPSSWSAHLLNLTSTVELENQTHSILFESKVKLEGEKNTRRGGWIVLAFSSPKTEDTVQNLIEFSFWSSVQNLVAADNKRDWERRKTQSNYTGSFHKPEIVLSPLHFQGDFTKINIWLQIFTAMLKIARDFKLL